MRHSILLRGQSHAAQGYWLAAGIAAGLVLGWVGARWVSQVAPEPSAAAHETSAEVITPANAATVNATIEFARTADLYERVRDANAATIEQLFEESATIARSDERLDTWTVLYARWASLDPSAALDHALAHGAIIDTPWSRAWIHSIFATWTRHDPGEAMSRLDQLPNGIAARATASVLNAIPAGDDRDAALKRMGLPAAFMPLATTPEWLVRVADDPAEALNEALREDRSVLGFKRARDVALTLASRDPAAALALVSAAEQNGDTDQTMVEIAALWAKRNPREAFDWGLTRPPSKLRSQMLAAALAALARTSPGTALDLASTLPDAGEQRIVLNSVVPSWASVDPVAAAAWYETADRRLRATTLQGVVSTYAQSDASAALTWVMRLPPDESALGLSVLVSDLAFRDPLRAVAMVKDTPAGAARDGAAILVVSIWALKDPQAAWRWSRRYDDSTVSGELLARVLSVWAHHDPRSANKALRSLDDAPLRDRAALGALTFTQGSEELLGIYERMSDPELKAQAARSVHDVLKHTDPVLAEEFATSAGIADASP